LKSCTTVPPDISNEDIQKHLKLRGEGKIQTLFQSPSRPNALFVLSKSDVGVCRNGGRRGSNFAPDAILAIFKNFMLPKKWQSLHFASQEISNVQDELEHFDTAQENAANRWLGLLQAMTTVKRFIHLGGGHDHIYPLLLGLSKQYDGVTIVNIDAHCDTRNDGWHHSGTPFRQFAKTSKIPFTLIQLGIHAFANPDSNYQKLEQGEMQVIPFAQLQADKSPKHKETFQAIFEQALAKGPLVLSLDADGISASEMEAVSSVNPQGLGINDVTEILCGLKLAQKLYPQTPIFFGIYEYNPIYDNLSQKGSRALAYLIYNFLDN